MPAFLKTATGRLLGFGTALVVVAWWIITIGGARWAVRIPDDTHTYGIRVRGGVDLFFPPGLGWFADHALWIFFLLLIATLAAEWFGRRRAVIDARVED